MCLCALIEEKIIVKAILCHTQSRLRCYSAALWHSLLLRAKVWLFICLIHYTINKLTELTEGNIDFPIYMEIDKISR